MEIFDQCIRYRLLNGLTNFENLDYEHYVNFKFLNHEEHNLEDNTNSDTISELNDSIDEYLNKELINLTENNIIIEDNDDDDILLENIHLSSYLDNELEKIPNKDEKKIPQNLSSGDNDDGLLLENCLILSYLDTQLDSIENNELLLIIDNNDNNEDNNDDASLLENLLNNS